MKNVKMWFDSLVQRIRNDKGFAFFLVALGIIFVIAAYFRTHELLDFPPGLHYDEGIDLMLANRLGDGELFLYSREGWGREGLYYYLVTITHLFVAYGPLALRLTTVLLSLILMGLGAYLGYRYHSMTLALISSGWFAVTFWAVSIGRVGVRNITLPVVLCLTVIAFGWAIGPIIRRAERPHLKRFALAGLLLGLSQYTYQPARFVPFLFIGFGLYLLLFHRAVWQRSWRSLAVFFGVGLSVALPLIFQLAQGGETGEAERAFVIRPLQELLAGHPGPVFQNLLATAGMFSLNGDPLIAYNVPERPVFVPLWTGLFFYLGLGIALWRWKRPVYAFTLIWLVVMAVPTIITEPAPHFNRAIAMQLPVFWLAALPGAELINRLSAARNRSLAGLVGVGLVVVLGVTAVSTWQAYFHDWLADPNLAVQYNTNVSRIMGYLAENEVERPTVISSRNYEDADPFIVAAGLGGWREDFRWLDSGQAVAFPGGDDIRLIVAGDRWLNSELSAYLGVGAQPDYADEAFFVLSIPNTLPGADGQAYTAELAVGEQQVINSPVLFESAESPGVGVQLLTAEFPETVTPGQPLNLVTIWSIPADSGPIPLSLFAHLLNSAGEIVTQNDELGYPPHNWRSRDEFVQVNTLVIPDWAAAGSYILQIGFYNRATGVRWGVASGQQTIGDHLILGTVQVE